MPSAAERLYSYILTRAQHEPVAKRIALYRDAAEVLSTEQHAIALRKLANDLEAIEQRHGQLRLDLGMPGTATPFNPSPQN